VGYFQVLYSYSICLVKGWLLFSGANKEPSPPKIILQQLGQSSTPEDPPVFAPPKKGLFFTQRRFYGMQNYSPQESLLSRHQ
jgi:hypothetical protein